MTTENSPSSSPSSPLPKVSPPTNGTYRDYFLYILAPSLILPVVLTGVTGWVAALPILKKQVQNDAVQQQILDAASHNALVVGEIRTFAFGGGRDDKRIKELRRLGWLECAGQDLDRRDFPELFAAIKEAWGSSKPGYFFNVPDLRAQFLRGWKNGGQVDESTDRVPSKPNGADKNNVGSSQNDAVVHHDHTLLGYGYKNMQVQPGNGTGVLISNGDPAPKVDTGAGVQFAAETRPKNVYVMFSIYAGKAIPEDIPDGSK